MPSWDSAEADALWTKACGAERWRGTVSPWARTSRTARTRSSATARGGATRARDVRSRASRSAAGGLRNRRAGARSGRERAQPGRLDHRAGAPVHGVQKAHAPPARSRAIRAPAGKSGRPVQVVVAGKAHPQDTEGKGLIAEWVRFSRQRDVRPHAVFLADYDLRLAEHLVQGVDLWINTPRPPREACGTSGMKVLVNGGLNLSFLDGWWAEAYRPEVGWAPQGDGRDDAADAARLYDMLENEVIPAFYDRDRKRCAAMARQDPREHGGTDPALLRQPGPPRILRALLPPGRPRIRTPERRGRRRPTALVAAELLHREALGRPSLRRGSRPDRGRPSPIRRCRLPGRHGSRARGRRALRRCECRWPAARVPMQSRGPLAHVDSATRRRYRTLAQPTTTARASCRPVKDHCVRSSFRSSGGPSSGDRGLPPGSVQHEVCRRIRACTRPRNRGMHAQTLRGIARMARAPKVSLALVSRGERTRYGPCFVARAEGRRTCWRP